MQELRCNILSEAVLKQADAICVTTNGVIRSNGELVMGRGSALSFAHKFPFLARELGSCVSYYGNVVNMASTDIAHPWHRGYTKILSFPTKEHWRDKSTLSLIERSAKELVKLADTFPFYNIWLPRPGCANGGLNWADVKPVLEGIFDDRFTVCYL